MKNVFHILILFFMCSFVFTVSDAYCLPFKYYISEVKIEKQRKPKFTFIDKVYFGHSKRKQELGGVNCIFNVGNYLLLGTETGLVRFNKSNFRAKRISSKRYDIQKVVKDKGIYWMVVEDNILEKRKLVKYRNGIFSTIYKAKESILSFDVLKSGKNRGVWIIREEYNFRDDIEKKRFVVRNSNSGLKKSSFILEAKIFDYRTDNKGALWIASNKGIYEISLEKKNKIISNRFEYISKKLQILDNSNTVHFISGDTLYSIDNGKLNIKEYRLGISGTILVNNSYLKHIENIGDDVNACTSGIIEIKESSMKIFNKNGLVNDTGKVLNLIKEHHDEDYMEYVKTFNVLPNGNFLFLVSGHGRAVHCFDGIYMFDGEKVVQLGYLTSGEQMIVDRYRVWIPDGADWHMVPKGEGGGLYLYEY